LATRRVVGVINDDRNSGLCRARVFERIDARHHLGAISPPLSG